MPRGAPGEVYQLAVEVELDLAVGAVADAHRLRTAVALEVVEDGLGQPVLAAHAVHHLQVVGVAGGCALDEQAEPPCLALEAEGEQRLQREARVAHPAVAVVPVAAGAHRLRQRGGGGGGDGAGGRVGQPLDDQRRAQHRLAAPLVAVGDVGLLAPAPPPVQGGGEAAVELLRPLLLRLVGVDAVRLGEAQSHPPAVAGTQGEARGQVVAAVHGQAQLVPHHQALVAADGGGDAVVVGADPGADRPVGEARTDPHRQLHLAFHPFDDAQELAVGVVAAADAHGEGVGQAGFAGGGGEAGLEHEGARQVAPARRPLDAGRRHRAEAAVVPVEQAAEDRLAVHARQRAPVDRAGARDEGGRVAVADEAVVRDRRVALVAHASSGL